MLKSVIFLLSVIAVAGIIPFGFSDPLYVQLEQGLEQNQLECENSKHLLVLRDNGKMACVTESTADKKGWKIINNILNDYDSSTYPEPLNWIGEIKYEKLPLTNESVPVSLNVTSLIDVPVTYSGFDYIILEHSANLEIIIDDKNIKQESYPELGNNVIVLEVPLLNSTQSHPIPITIKAVGSGNAEFIVNEMGGVITELKFVVGDTQTSLYENYIKFNPEFPAIQAAPPLLTSNTEIDCINFNENTQNCFEMFVKEEGQNDGSTIEYYYDDWDLMTLDELFIYLQNTMGLDEEQAQEIIQMENVTRAEQKKTTALNTNNQIGNFTETSSLQSAAAANSFRLVMPVYNAQAPLDSDSRTGVHGAKVCVYDADLKNGGLDLVKNTSYRDIPCTYTSKTGVVVFANILNDDPNDSGSGNGLDIRLKYSTDGNYVDLTNNANQHYTYTKQFANNVEVFPSSLLIRQTFTGFTQLESAMWIIDNLHDARDKFDDENVRIGKVNVIWKWNQDLTNILPAEYKQDGTRDTDLNARYKTSLSTIYLDGNVGSVKGDSYEPWTQYHEYGHHVMNVLMNDRGLGWGGCTGDGHSILATNSETCAWSEGFADFVPNFVVGDEAVQRSAFTWYNLEKGGRTLIKSSDPLQDRSFPPVNNPDASLRSEKVGQLSEGRVASMLWDLYDSTKSTVYDKNQDQLNENSRTITDVIKELKKIASRTNIMITEDFYKTWNSEHSTKSLDNLATLHYMDFVNVKPVASAVTAFSLIEGTENTFWLRGTDANNDTLTFKITQQPSKGTLVKESGTHPQGQVYKYTANRNVSGTDTFKFKVNDGVVDSDNEITVTITINRLVDSTDPQVTITQPTTNTHYDTENNRVTVGGTSSDNVGVVSLVLKLDGVTIGTLSSGLDNWTHGPFTVSRSTSTLIVTATDAAGNTSNDTLFIRYNDPSHSSPPKTSTPTASSVTTTSVTVNWVAPTSIPTIENYDLFRTDSVKSLIATVPATQLSYTDNTVLASTTYSYTVAAKNSFGSGAESDAITVTTLAPADTTKPTAAITYSKSGPYNTGDIITITATFSEDMKDSPKPKIAISGSNSVTAVEMTKSSNTIYTYSHTVTTGTGDAIITLSVGQDLAGNLITTIPTTGAIFKVDNTQIISDIFGTFGTNLTVAAGTTVSVTSANYTNLTIEDGGVLAVTNGIIRVSASYTEIGTGHIKVVDTGCISGNAGTTRGGTGGGQTAGSPTFQTHANPGGSASKVAPTVSATCVNPSLPTIGNGILDVTFVNLFNTIFGGQGSDGTDAQTSGNGGNSGSGGRWNNSWHVGLAGGNGGTAANGVDGVQGSGKIAVYVNNISSTLTINANGTDGNDGLKGQNVGQTSGKTSSTPRATFYGQNGQPASAAGSLGSSGSQGGVVYVVYDLIPTGTTPTVDVSGGLGGFNGADRSATTSVTTTRATSGDNGFSFTKTVNTDTVPDAPTGVTTDYSSNSITLNWIAPNNGGAPITDYIISYKSSSEPFFRTFNDGVSTATTATVDGLNRGTTYDFIVQAVNSVGTGSPSSMVTATPSDNPSIPIGLTASYGSDYITLSWSTPTNTGSSPILDYYIQYKDLTELSWNVLPHGSDATTATVTGLTTGVQYFFKVNAVNYGHGNPTPIISATPSNHPSIPIGLTATPGNNQITLSWSTPANTGSSPILDYYIQYKESSSNGWIVLPHGSVATTATVTGLTNGISYDFKVNAVNYGHGNPTPVISAIPSIPT